MKFSHDSKITVQVFNTLSSKFPQIITNLTEDTELAFTERLERLYLIINLLIVLLSHILNKSNSNFVFEFSWNFCPIPIFIFPLELLSYAINYLFKVAFSKLLFSQAMQWFLFLKLQKYLIKTNSSLLRVSHFINVFCF